MRKIAISLSKGGVGKSSTAVTIAQGLARAGRKVLLIDTDDQGQHAFLLGVKPPIGLAEVLNEEATIKEALFQARDNLWLLAGGKSLSGAKRSLLSYLPALSSSYCSHCMGNDNFKKIHQKSHLCFPFCVHHDTACPANNPYWQCNNGREVHLYAFNRHLLYSKRRFLLSL